MYLSYEVISGLGMAFMSPQHILKLNHEGKEAYAKLIYREVRKREVTTSNTKNQMKRSEKK